MIKALYHQSQPAGYKLSQVQLVDLNVDGRADLLAIKNNGQYVILYAGEDGHFGDPVDPFATKEDGRPVLAMYANPNGSFEIMPEEAEPAAGQKRVYANPLSIRTDQHILGITFAPGENKKEPRLLSLYADGELSSHPFYIDVAPEKNYITSGGENDGHVFNRLKMG